VKPKGRQKSRRKDWGWLVKITLKIYFRRLRHLPARRVKEGKQKKL